MRHPVIITSLEEDFRNIGILPKEEKPAAADPEALAEDTDPEDTEGVSAEELAAALEGVEISEDNLEEIARRIKAIIRGGKRVKVKHHATAAERMKSKKARKSAAGRKSARKAAKKRKSTKGKKHAGLVSKWRKRFGLEDSPAASRIANILEDVQEIISTVDEDNVENAVKSFANVAIISEMLSRVFEAVKADFEDEEGAKELGEAAEFFGELAEEAAGLATLLHEGVDEDTPEDEIPSYEDIEARFQEHMDALIEGLELYADLTEEDDSDDADPTEEGTDEED